MLNIHCSNSSRWN